MSTSLIFSCGCAILSGEKNTLKYLHACETHKLQAFNDALNDKINPQVEEKLLDDAIIKRVEDLEAHENALHEFIECYNKNLELIPLSVRYQFAKILEKYNK